MAQHNDDYSKATEVCSLMSETMSSLAADAIALRQLTSIAKLRGIFVETEDNENVHPDHSSHTTKAKRTNYDENDPIDGLEELDDTVAAIETRVAALRSIVMEEKRGLEEFETSLQLEANAQREVISHMFRACHDYSSVWKEDRTPERKMRPARNHTADERLGTISSGAVKLPASSASTNNARATTRRRKDSLDPRRHNPHQAEPKQKLHGSSFFEEATARAEEVQSDRWPLPTGELVLAPATEAELMGISRNTRGRISILAVNEALEEIETVCRNKFLLLSRMNTSMTAAVNKSNKKFALLHGGQHATNSLERRFEYLKQQRANLDHEVDAHAGHFWVSEQELRENCAFFRWGEGTARATLAVLCALKRLKQVPGKNLGVTYLCLSSTA